MDMVKEAKHFGVEVSGGNFDWLTLKEARDSYITRLNGIYERNLANSGVKIIEGVSGQTQSLCPVDKHTADRTLTGQTKKERLDCRHEMTHFSRFQLAGFVSPAFIFLDKSNWRGLTP